MDPTFRALRDRVLAVESAFGGRPARGVARRSILASPCGFAAPRRSAPLRQDGTTAAFGAEPQLGFRCRHAIGGTSDDLEVLEVKLRGTTVRQREDDPLARGRSGAA